MRKSVAAVALASLALFGFGCKSPTQMLTEKITEKATEGYINSKLGGEGKVDLSNNQMNINGKDGAFSYGEDVKLPDSFPSDVPVYAGTKLSMVSTPKDATQPALVIGQSKDSLDKVSAWYETELKSKGWSKDSDMNSTGLWYRTYTKDKRTMTVSLSSSDDGTTITLSSEQEQK